MVPRRPCFTELGFHLGMGLSTHVQHDPIPVLQCGVRRKW